MRRLRTELLYKYPYGRSEIGCDGNVRFCRYGRRWRPAAEYCQRNADAGQQMLEMGGRNHEKL